MNYAEYRPASALAPFIHCYWTLDGAGGDAPEVVLPDGRVELIIHYGDPFRYVDDTGQETGQAAAFFAGQIARAIRLVPARCAGVVGVRFRYTGAAGFLRVPLGELAGRFTPLEQLWGPGARSLVNRILDAGGPLERVSLLDAFLLRRLARPSYDPAIDAAVSRLAAVGGSLPVARLAQEAGWSPRHFERRFLARVGLRPKKFARILRFQRALRGGAGALDPYYDQSHFIRDFREFTGHTPTSWSGAPRELMSHFSNTKPPPAR